LISLITSTTLIPTSNLLWRLSRKDHLPFLDVEIYRTPDGSLGHTVFRMPIYSNLYPAAESIHRPAKIIRCYPPPYTEL